MDDADSNYQLESDHNTDTEKEKDNAEEIQVPKEFDLGKGKQTRWK